ncbi:MAG: glycosyltransferase family protein [Chitinophagales bacterium]
MKKRILFGILNWGLGHATRSTPLIRYLLQEGYEVVLVSDGLALELLQKEFPELAIESCVGYEAEYAESASNFSIQMALQIPKFLKAINAEQELCKQLCLKHQIDLIISDNRYGFYHDFIPNVLICHQLRLLYPASALFENIVNRSYKTFLRKFDKIWVPDFAGAYKLSGKLSQLDWKNIEFIGASSRLKQKELPLVYDFLAILSGPEPQRTILENKLLKLLSSLPGKHALVRGSTDNSPQRDYTNITCFDILNSQEMELLIAQTKFLIGRSGYTSIIDYIHLQKTCLLIPTPGQVEQEYLAQRLTDKSDFISCEQENLQLENLKELATCSPSKWPKTEYNYSLIQQFLLCSTS